MEVMDVNSTGLNFIWNQKPRGSNGILKKIDRIMDNLKFNDDFLRSFAIFQPNCFMVNWIQTQKAIDGDTSSTILREKHAHYLVAFKEDSLDEDRFLKQKSKVEWLNAGDSYTSYFHRVFKSKCAWNRIEMVRDSSNVFYEGNAVVDQDLYSRALDAHKADAMVRDVTDFKVKAAIFSMGGDKFSRPDDFLLLRYSFVNICSASFIVNMEDDVDINSLTIEQYLAWVQDDIRPDVIKPKINNDVEFEINSNFMRKLRRKLFKGTDDEDAHEHVRRVLEIADLFHFLGVTHDAVMLRVFPIKLKGPALRWINRLPAGLVTIWDLLEKSFIRQYCPPFKTAKKLEIILNFKQELDETLYHAWERVLDSKGFIPLMTQTQALISIQVMAEHSHNWYDEATTKEQINDSPNNDDTKKPKENIHAIQTSFKNYEGAHLTMEYPLEKKDKAVEQRKIPKEIKKDDGDMNDDCDIMVEDVESLKKILTPLIHALPNLKPIVQPYIPLGLVYNKEKVVKEEEQDYDIPLHEHVMQPLTP
ncbi:reverse transcriptase domain-containing protein [Tanacetum coccineum]